MLDTKAKSIFPTVVTAALVSSANVTAQPRSLKRKLETG